MMMAGSSQVRAVIELFCKILEENYVCDIRAETLRQAKFNKESANKPLWKLLFNVVCFCNGDSSNSKPAVFQDLKEEDVVFVKTELQKWGYLNQSFARLSQDFSNGSRELLLALGWTIHTQKLFDKITAARSNPLQQELITFLHPEGEQTSTESLPPSRQRSKDLANQEKIQQQLMLCGKLRLSLRRLYMVQQELTGLKFTICKSTDGVSLQADRNYLSPLEVHMLRYPDSFKKMMLQIEEDNTQVKNLLEWKDKEHVFWEWMESVLHLHIQEKKSAVSDAPTPVEGVYLPVPEDLGKAVAMARTNLRDFILQHEDDMEMFEQLLLRKKVSQVEVNALNHRLDNEISQLTQRLQDCGRGWMWDKENQESKLPVEYVARPDYLGSQTTLLLQQKSKPKYVVQDTQAIRRAKQAHVLEVAENEISNLERRVHQLDSQLKQLEKENLQKLQTVIEKDSSVICIQPRYCKQFFLSTN